MTVTIANLTPDDRTRGEQHEYYLVRWRQWQWGWRLGLVAFPLQLLHLASRHHLFEGGLGPGRTVGDEGESGADEVSRRLLRLPRRRRRLLLDTLRLDSDAAGARPAAAGVHQVALRRVAANAAVGAVVVARLQAQRALVDESGRRRHRCRRGVAAVRRRL